MAASIFHEKRQTFSFHNGNHLLAMQKRNGDMHSYSAFADFFFFSSLDGNAGLTLPLKQWKTQLATDVIKHTLNVEKKKILQCMCLFWMSGLHPVVGATRRSVQVIYTWPGAQKNKHRPLIRRAASS